jgi:hypothetical protein
MTKKSKRAKAKHRVRVINKAQVERAQQPEQMPAGVSLPAQASPKVQPSKVQDLTGRHQHVMPEIKRIGIIAGAIIIVLIILSFVLG